MKLERIGFFIFYFYGLWGLWVVQLENRDLGAGGGGLEIIFFFYIYI